MTVNISPICVVAHLSGKASLLTLTSQCLHKSVEFIEGGGEFAHGFLGEELGGGEVVAVDAVFVFDPSNIKRVVFGIGNPTTIKDTPAAVGFGGCFAFLWEGPIAFLAWAAAVGLFAVEFYKR